MKKNNISILILGYSMIYIFGIVSFPALWLVGSRVAPPSEYEKRMRALPREEMTYITMEISFDQPKITFRGKELELKTLQLMIKEAEGYYFFHRDHENGYQLYWWPEPEPRITDFNIVSEVQEENPGAYLELQWYNFIHVKQYFYTKGIRKESIQKLIPHFGCDELFFKETITIEVHFRKLKDYHIHPRFKLRGARPITFYTLYFKEISRDEHGIILELVDYKGNLLIKP